MIIHHEEENLKTEINEENETGTMIFKKKDLKDKFNNWHF